MERLSAAARRLQAKMEAFRIHKETIKAEYTAAQAAAAASAHQVVGGILGEMGDVEMATRRAEDRTAQLQARASALDELLSSGALGDVTAPASDEQIQAQLDAITTQAAVEEELARIRERLASEPSQPPGEPAQGRRAAAAGTPQGHPTSPQDTTPS
jgi:phage shock protein A